MNDRLCLRRLTAVLAALTLWGCERDDICPENTAGTPAARVEFRTYDAAGEAVEYAPQGVRFYGLRGKERLAELTGGDGATWLQLPVDFEAETSRYLIEQAGRTDTLTLHYTPELEFISKACGFRFVFSGMTALCTAAGPVLSFTDDLQTPPADGRLFDSRQTVATLYFPSETPQP